MNVRVCRYKVPVEKEAHIQYVTGVIIVDNLLHVEGKVTAGTRIVVCGVVSRAAFSWSASFLLYCLIWWLILLCRRRAGELSETDEKYLWRRLGMCFDGSDP
jgi:hypothetical protein